MDRLKSHLEHSIPHYTGCNHLSALGSFPRACSWGHGVALPACRIGNGFLPGILWKTDSKGGEKEGPWWLCGGQ